MYQVKILGENGYGKTTKEYISYCNSHGDIKTRKYYSERFIEYTFLKIQLQHWGGGF